jgi:hypothetical protein
MPQPVLLRLRQYFQDMADVLAGQRAASRVFPNTSDVGSTREDLLFTFLRTHLPKRCEVVRGGFVFDAQGVESKQIDLIVTSDLTLQFQPVEHGASSGKSFNCLEGTYCVISVKSTLSRPELFDALGNIASVPGYSHALVQFHPMLSVGDVPELMPYRVVFAFDGPSLDTELNNIQDYYEQHVTPLSKMANLLIVNNKYVIARAGSAGLTYKSGELVGPGTLVPNVGPFVGGYGLLVLLTAIQTNVNVGSHSIFLFGQYVDRLDM